MNLSDDIALDIVQRLSRIEAHAETNASIAKDHEERIRGTERKLWLFSGAAVVLGPILQPVLAKLGIHIPT